MKKNDIKKYLAIGTSIVAVLSFSACTSVGNTNQVTPAATNQVSPEEVSGDSSAKKEASFKTVNLGDQVTTDFIEMTVDKASTSQKIEPPDTSSVYSYLADQDGETYFYLTGKIKNTGGDSYDVEDMLVQFTFDDKYNYTGIVAACEEKGDDFYADYVKPFGVVKYYMYASVPDELIKSYSTCVVQFGFHENIEHDWSADFSDLEYCYQVNLKK